MGIKISQLPALGTALPPDAELEIAYGANSYKVTGQEIADGSGGGGPAAWATFSGTSSPAPALLGSSNILSLDQVATGHYKLTFATSLATSTYAAVFGSQRGDPGAPFVVAAIGLGETADFDGATVKIGTEVPSALAYLGSLVFDGVRGLSGSVPNAPSGANGQATLFGYLLPDVGFSFVSCKLTTFSPNTIGEKLWGCFVANTARTKFITIGATTTTGQVHAWREGDNELSTGTPSIGLPGYFRIIQTTGTEWSYETSTNGSSWTSRGTYDPGEAMDLCGFACFSRGNSAGTYSIDLDDFTTDTQPAPTPAKTEEWCYVETFDPTTGDRINPTLACVAFFE